MAQRKQQQLEGENKRSIAQKARRARELSAISELADQNLATTDEWRVLLPEHLAAIKFRLLGGDTLGNICRELGIERGVVCNYIYEHPEYAREVLDFKAFGAHSLYERLLEMIDDKEMSASDKLFAYKVISNYAPKINRETYGDKVQVEHTVPDPFIIEGALLDNGEDDGV